LKRLREDRGLTQEALAFKSGVSISSLGPDRDGPHERRVDNRSPARSCPRREHGRAWLDGGCRAV